MGMHMNGCTVGAVFGAGVAAFLFLSPDLAAAQTTPGATAASNVPRTADGQPDIQGWWESDAYTPNLETGLTDPVTAQLQGQPAPNPADEVSVVVDPPDGRIPYQAWAADKRNAIPSHRRGPTSTGVTETVRDVRPRTFCLHGMPRSGLYGFQLTQVPGYVILAWEFSHAYRIIPLTDRPHIAPNIKGFIQLGFLGQKTNFGVRVQPSCSFKIFVVFSHDPQNGGFSGTIGPNDPNLCTGIK